MSATVQARPKFTPEDLLAMPDGVGCELVDGALVERNISLESSWVAAKLGRLLGNVQGIDTLGGIIGPDLGYRCFPDRPGKVRKPDLSFIRWDRLGPGDIEAGFCPVAPDLAVEVLSPNDTADEFEVKVQESLDAGVRLVWVVRPGGRIVEVHTPDGRVVTFSQGEMLACEAVIPGSRCRVADLFPTSC